jgi:hypothetical protein
MYPREGTALTESDVAFAAEAASVLSEPVVYDCHVILAGEAHL